MCTGSLKMIIMCIFKQTTLTFASSQTFKDALVFLCLFRKAAHLLSQGHELRNSVQEPSLLVAAVLRSSI